MGVWIETRLDQKAWRQQIVTPFVGVWIETNIKVQILQVYQSHPSWVCGLKRQYLNDPDLMFRSHPSWVCGLKPHQYPTKDGALSVTPFVGVWIETCRSYLDIPGRAVTPFVGVWIETWQSLRFAG